MEYTVNPSPLINLNDYLSWGMSNRRAQYLSPYDAIASIKAYNTSPLLRSASRSFADNVIGTGLRMQPAPIDTIATIPNRDAWVKSTEQQFLLWGKRNQWYHKQYEIYKTCKVMGSALVFLTLTPQNEIRLTVADPTIIDIGKTIEQEGIYNGVEINRYNELIAIHIRQHPEYAMPMKRIPLYSRTGKRNFILYTVPDLAGEIRGSGAFSNLSNLAYNIDQFLDAMVLAAKVNASVLGYVKTELNQIASAVIGSKNVKGANQDEKVRFAESGTFTRLNPQESLEFFDSNRHTPQIRDFLESLAEIVGMHIGLPASMILMRFSKSYSASRAEILESRKTFNTDRKHFIESVGDIVFYEWFKREYIAKRVQAKGFEEEIVRMGYTHCTWQGDPQPSLDPLKEANAQRVLLDSKIMSRDTVASYYGINFEDEAKKIQQENEIVTEMQVETMKAMAEANPMNEENSNNKKTDTSVKNTKSRDSEERDE